MSPLALAIDGMSCHHCVTAVNQALAAMPGVAIQLVRIGRAELSFDPAQADPDRIVAAIAEAGYRARPVSGQPA